MAKRSPRGRKARRGARHAVFICHSSKDKWIARHMAKEIESTLGGGLVSAFLDEKDIKGGDSIPERVRDGLEEAAEFVVLLSRNSIDRPWVLFEIGGAWTLRKRIIAILHGILPSEMPEILVPFKAHELNDFADYLVELAERVGKGKG